MTPVHGKNIPADIVCLGGDQLTEKRARNIQKARPDGCPMNVTERLDGVWTKNEDWHGIRIAYQVWSIFLTIIVN